MAALLAELRALGAPVVCHVMSERYDCDARLMPLTAALEALSDDCCALLVCLPGVVALHLPEAPAPPVILSVKAQPTSSVALPVSANVRFCRCPDVGCDDRHQGTRGSHAP